MPATMDGYIRVSRVSGRAGESYISPKVQRDKITGWAKLHDVTLGQIVVEEDVSGAKPIEERELGELLKRVESGVKGLEVCREMGISSRSSAC